MSYRRRIDVDSMWSACWENLEMENPIINETNTTTGKTQKDENLDGLLKDMKSFKGFRDSVESRLHSMEEAIIANSNLQKASLPSL